MGSGLWAWGLWVYGFMGLESRVHASGVYGIRGLESSGAGFSG